MAYRKGFQNMKNGFKNKALRNFFLCSHQAGISQQQRLFCSLPEAWQTFAPDYVIKEPNFSLLIPILA